MRTVSENPRRVAMAGVAYFAMVFGAGFILGSIRVPFLVPRLGERTSELIEMPFMLIVVVYSARFVVRRFALTPATSVRLGVGLIALGLLLAAELLLAVVLQNRSLAEYIASRDRASGSVYLAMLLLFSVMPLVLARVQRARETHVA